MTNRKAIVNNIIPFSSVDGPGNRTAIFFQGCNINCSYCHNPETINVCNSCGKCVEECPVEALFRENGKVIWNRDLCIQCDKCIEVCMRDSSPKVREYTVDELVEEISRYSSFIQGVTVSGGECSLRWEFLTEFFEKTRDLGLTNFVDTNGTVSLWDKEEFVEVTDKFMVDLKAHDLNEHMMLTHKGNENVLKNIEFLLEKKKIFEIRTVIVPKVLENKKIVYLGSKLIAENDNKVRYKLIKFRNHGVRGNMKNIESPSEEYMKKLSDIAKENGCKEVIVL